MRWKVFLIGFAKRITHKENSAQESLSTLCAVFSNIPFIGPKFCALLVRNSSKRIKTALLKYIDNSIHFRIIRANFATIFHVSQAVGGGFEFRILLQNKAAECLNFRCSAVFHFCSRFKLFPGGRFPVRWHNGEEIPMFQSTTGTSSPNSSGRKRGQTFSVMQMTDAARRLPISQDSASVLP